MQKLDLGNIKQFHLLVEYFSYNIKTINFWLNESVFPVEMQQYRQRLSGNAWHLAQNLNGGAIGFSGTNDNHRLLPLVVNQHFPQKETVMRSSWDSRVWREMLSTNGKMIDVIIKETVEIIELVEGPAIYAILSLVSENIMEYHVLIDAGALLAGNDNCDIASKFIQLKNFPFQGVVFPEARGGNTSQWKIMDRFRKILPLSLSSIPEHECFAIFDEPRCRGSDLKLSPTAVALLTIGPGLCKDKLMQAAGRMRKIGRSQKLVIIGQQDVFAEMRMNCKSHSFNAKEVLTWTIANTVSANESGFVDWANQGLFYCTTKHKPTKCIEDEKLSLEEMYAKLNEHIEAKGAIEVASNYHIERTGGGGELDNQKNLIL